MEKLCNGQPGPHECWEELAEHALTHDDLPGPEAPAACVACGGPADGSCVICDQPVCDEHSRMKDWDRCCLSHQLAEQGGVAAGVASGVTHTTLMTLDEARREAKIRGTGTGWAPVEVRTVGHV